MARVLVMGCGGIGGVLSALLTEAGVDLTTYTTNEAIADAVRGHGFRLAGAGAARAVRGRIATALPAGPFDLVLLATQPPDVERAARTALPALAGGGALVCLQNGLCEERIINIAGPDRTFGAVVSWGASMLAPGAYEKTADGGFTIGRLDGRADPRLDDLARVLAPIGPVEQTTNLAGKRWSKLALNCAISALGTVGGDRLGALLGHRFVRRLALRVMTEAVVVARREGVRLEKVAGTLDLEWVALRDGESAARLLAKHALLVAVGLRYRKLRSSMLSAIERGRTPAIDFLNGEVVTRAARHGISVPVNALLQQTVWQLARGERKPSVALLRGVYEATS